jgi:hypothetical protein
VKLVDERTTADTEGLRGFGPVVVVLSQRQHNCLPLYFAQAPGIGGGGYGGDSVPMAPAVAECQL